jgi:hypothetical protein
MATNGRDGDSGRCVRSRWSWLDPVGHYPAHVRPGERRASAAAGRWLSGLLGRGQDGNGTMRCSRTQLDLMGHDPKPASR